MAQVSGLVPARFLTMVAHLILLIVLMWSRYNNVVACLPIGFTQQEFDFRDTQLIIGLSVGIGLLVFELVGFMGGISMFMPTQSLISPAAHAAGTVALTFFLFNQWPCTDYWFIFGFCSAFPALTEIFTWVGNLGTMAAHAGAAVALAYFILDQMPCHSYWFIFGFCSALPAIIEITMFVMVLGCNK